MQRTPRKGELFVGGVRVYLVKLILTRQHAVRLAKKS